MANRVLGIDISKWQGDFNFRKLVNQTSVQPMRFVIMKATQGTNVVDRKFRENWEKAKEVGIYRGTYHFYDGGVDPKRQAQHYFNAVKKTGDMGELPPVLDVESRNMRPDNIKTCLNEIERLWGVQPIIYTGVGVWNSLGTVKWADKYPLWLARYLAGEFDESKLNRALTGGPIGLPRGFSEWVIWQFSADGNLKGRDLGASSRSIDINVFQGTEEALQRLAVAKPGAPTLPPGEGSTTPTPPRVKDITEKYIDAMNTRLPDNVIALYADNGVHVTGKGTKAGKNNILAHYAEMFVVKMPGATFKLKAFGGKGASRQLTWEASSRGRVVRGNDTFGLKDDKIVYHYTSLKLP